MIVACSPMSSSTVAGSTRNPAHLPLSSLKGRLIHQELSLQGQELSDQLQPLVAPQVSHLRHVPLRTMVNWPHSEHISPS